jgi:deazaflavin-dependent oxidoreductase (nitroreductase family)
MSLSASPLTLRQRAQKFWRRFPVYLYRLGFGPLLAPLPLLILTTRKTTTTGPRHTPLEYRRHGSRLYVISPEPDTARWFAHVQAQRFATIRIGRHTHSVQTTIVTDEAEAVRALFLFRLNTPLPLRWLIWSARKQNEIRPQALKKTARRYAVVRLELAEHPADDVMPAVTADRAWTWWGVLGMAALLWLIRRLRR